MAMAQFVVTSSIVSTVLSAFMGGLGLGSWLSGRMLTRYEGKIRFPVLLLYAGTELIIGLSTLLLPVEFSYGHRLLQSVAYWSTSSFAYYAASALLISLAVIPWCSLMGATIPVAMAAIRSERRADNGRSFSFLYLSNIVGAVFGAIVPLFLIEKYGFRFTLRCGLFLNLTVAVIAFAVSYGKEHRTFAVAAPEQDKIISRGRVDSVLILLFMTGLTTMAMELIWIRLFTVYLGPLVYSFALILSSYLFGTFIGSTIYRDASSNKNFVGSKAVWVLIPLFGTLALVFGDPRLPFVTILRPLAAVAPFAAAVGYLTPMLVDRWAEGDPERAGRAYAVNIVGCIIGPLLGSFFLLPVFGEHVSMVLLVFPWLFIAAPWKRFSAFVPRVLSYGCMALCVVILLTTKDYSILFSPRKVLRDSTATVTATGKGMRKQLLVNGTGMTMLQPTTKMMAHMTLASLAESPRNALVICFGMGTTHRSVISWGVSSTAVELVPSVPKLFSFYHSDADNVLASPFSHVVIDDGRRFLERSHERFDAIIIDPPPPVWAAGSSLLYSKEFYELAKKHLSERGILQQWLPGIGEAEQAAIARALRDSFAYVRVFPALEPSGWHFLASMQPIPLRTATELALRMPHEAISDMLEWGPAKTAEQQFQLLLSKEMKTSEMVALSPETPPVQDDRPVNEYFLLRTLRAGKLASGARTQASQATQDPDH